MSHLCLSRISLRSEMSISFPSQSFDAIIELTLSHKSYICFLSSLQTTWPLLLSSGYFAYISWISFALRLGGLPIIGLCWNYSYDPDLRPLNLDSGFGVRLIMGLLKNLHFERVMGGGSDLFATPNRFPSLRPVSELSSSNRLWTPGCTTTVWPSCFIWLPALVILD